MEKELPSHTNWNDFWSLNASQKQKKVSWSKIRIIEILSLYIREGMKVLDAGCGSGFFSKYFCGRNCKVFSVDYSDEALNICRKFTDGKSAILKLDLLSENFADNVETNFDLIFSDGLFEHFSEGDQDKILSNLKKIISDDGLLVTFVPNKFSPWELIRPFYMPGIKEKPFTLNSLINLNKRNNFSIVDKGGINTFPYVFSPDRIFGKYFGMLLFTLAKKNF